jgi:hypothetical protein
MAIPKPTIQTRRLGKAKTNGPKPCLSTSMFDMPTNRPTLKKVDRISAIPVTMTNTLVRLN